MSAMLINMNVYRFLLIDDKGYSLPHLKVQFWPSQKYFHVYRLLEYRGRAIQLTKSTGPIKWR